MTHKIGKGQFPNRFRCITCNKEGEMWKYKTDWSPTGKRPTGKEFWDVAHALYTYSSVQEPFPQGNGDQEHFARITQFMKDVVFSQKLTILENMGFKHLGNGEFEACPFTSTPDKLNQSTMEVNPLTVQDIVLRLDKLESILQRLVTEINL